MYRQPSDAWVETKLNGVWKDPATCAAAVMTLCVEHCGLRPRSVNKTEA